MRLVHGRGDALQQDDTGHRERVGERFGIAALDHVTLHEARAVRDEREDRGAERKAVEREYPEAARLDEAQQHRDGHQLLTAAVATPTARGSVTPPSASAFGTFSTAAAAMIGIDIRKLNVAALARSNPSARPAVMVAPERETPGMNANACAHPTSSASGSSEAVQRRGAATRARRRSRAPPPSR